MNHVCQISITTSKNPAVVNTINIYIIYIYTYIYIHIYIYICVCVYIYSEVMKTIQCAHHPPHLHNGFVVTCRLWTASGGVHALLVLEPTVCSTSTKQGA